MKACSWALGAALIAGFTFAHAENGVYPESIVIGQSAALSGPASGLGTGMREGATAYFDEVNRNGGVHGRKIELKSLDDGYDPERAAANTKKLIEDEKVFALFGYVGTPTSQASLPVFTAAKVPFFGPYTGAELLRDPFNKYIFNVRASYYDETEKIVQHLTTASLTNIAVMYQNDSYGKAGLAGVERAMSKRNLKISATGTVERNTTDVAAAVKSISEARPDAVVMISAYRSCAEFIRQAKKAGMKSQFFNVSFVGTKSLADDLGNDGVGVAISQIMPFPWGAEAVVRDYQKAMARTNPKSGLDYTSIEGYIAAKVFVEGLRRVGKDLTRDKLIAELEKINQLDVGGFVVSFAPASHSGSKYVDLTIIGRGNKLVR
jgi:ABC-type branched-subunit amino acid transport system substrate-binding protein